MTLIIDCDKITTMNMFHEYIAAELNFPDYYGKNMDALSDILSVWSESLKIVVTDSVKLKENLGRYGLLLIDLFYQLEYNNENIVFEKH